MPLTTTIGAASVRGFGMPSGFPDNGLSWQNSTDIIVWSTGTDYIIWG